MNVLDRFAWMDRASCVQAKAGDTPEPGAGEICAGCPVSGECVTFTGEHVTLANIERLFPACGTERGAKRHYRAGGKPCDACRAAHNFARVARKARAS